MYGSVGEEGQAKARSTAGSVPTSIQGHGRIDSSHSPPVQNTLKKELSFFGATAVVINLIIGSGVFITTSEILQHTGSFGLTMVLWGVGALIAYAGMLCYLEMGLLLKKSGGTYVFVKEGYSFGRSKPWMDVFGSVMAFMYAWSTVFLGEPLACALILLAVGRYACRPFFLECQDMPIYAVKSFALFALTLLLILNICSAKLTAKLHTWISGAKILALLLVIVLGIWKLIQRGSFPEDSRHPFNGSNFHPASIALGLYGVIYAYDGWSVGVTVQEEIKSVKATIRMAFVSIPVIAALYILTSISFFAVLSYEELLETKAVGLEFGSVALGKPGVVIFSLLGLILTFGGAHANVFEASRILFITSREGSVPGFISGIHKTFKTPVQSIVIECVLCALFIMVGSIDSLLNILGVNTWFWYGSAFLALIIMRLTMPHKPRPFKVILLLPSLMLAMSIFLIVLPLWQNPVPQLLGIACVLSGLPIYFIFVMEHPCRLRPRLLDRVSSWLVSVTSKLFNTELADAFL